MIVPSKEYVTSWSHSTSSSVMYPQKVGTFCLRIPLGTSGLKETGRRFLNRNMQPLICMLLTPENNTVVIVNLETGVLF